MIQLEVQLARFTTTEGAACNVYKAASTWAAAGDVKGVERAAALLCRDMQVGHAIQRRASEADACASNCM